MNSKRSVKCAKCGITPLEDSSLNFHRFPLPSKLATLKAKVWAQFCFPDSDWTNLEALKKLNTQHNMICSKHFDDSSYTSSDRKRLNKFAVPTEAQNILRQLRDEQFNAPKDHNVQPSTSQCNIQENVPLQFTVTTKQSQKKGILKDIDAQKHIELTPRKQKLYKRCRKNLSEIIRLRKQIKATKKSKRSILSTLESNKYVQNIMKSKISSSFYLLLQSQIKNCPRKLLGRRWTMDDKVLALSIYKKSSSCYKLLRRLFCLPSISSLKGLLNKIPLICGINNQVMETVKQITAVKNIDDNLCILAFDEMSIRKNLIYNPKLDQIEGYQDHANQGRTSEVASHALTFMAIGLRKNWKQPMAFYFSGGCVTADRLAVLIKEVLSACFLAGLEVIGVVSDMDGVNVRAINCLGSSTEQPYFIHEGHEIVTLFDPPHLLKCFRNNFMKHNIQFNEETQIEGNPNQAIARIAKWSHIDEFYKMDKINPNFVFAPALTNQHLQPNGKQKMKVRLAAQV